MVVGEKEKEDAFGGGGKQGPIGQAARDTFLTSEDLLHVKPNHNQSTESTE